MTSGSEQHSSSSPPRDKHRAGQRSRSRQRERPRRSYDAPPYPSETRKVKIRIPELTADLLSFRDFLIHQTERINIQSGQRAYQKYKKEWEEKQHEVFLNQYRNDAWFRQKYDPQFLEAIENQRKQNVKKQFQQFIANLENKVYEKIDLSVKDPSSLGFTLQNQRHEEDDSSPSSLINSQTIDVALNQNLDISKEPSFGFDPDQRTLFIKNVPKNISRFDIREVTLQFKGFKNITMSEPAKKNGLSRYCWVQFSDQKSTEQASLGMSAIMIKDEKLLCSPSVSKIKKVKIIKNYPLSRVSEDLQAAIAISKKLDQQCQIKENPLYTFTFDSQKQNLDIILLYLRRVHAFDYFTCSMFENQRILSLKLGSCTLRVEADYQELENVQTVFKKIKQVVMEKANQQTGGIDHLASLRDQIQKHIRESEKVSKDAKKDVWKCLHCDKKFKTCQFLAKHMIKHPQAKNKRIQAIMDQAYIKDPKKITNLSLRQRDNRESFRDRRPYNPNFRRGRRENYRDFDEPEGEKTTKVAAKPMINYLDI